MAKICPYNRAKETQRCVQRQHFSDNEDSDGYDYQMTVEFTPAECVQSDCGAWHNGKCSYAAVSFSND